jgi:putative tryptophan/tyrosine transport system substrate-binding protein
LELIVLHAGALSEFDAAFATLTQKNIDTIIVSAVPFFISHRGQLVALAARYFKPVVYYAREFVTAGGLLSYASSFTDSFHEAATYVRRILKGEKAANLPMMQPTKFELVFNLKTAKTLGLDVPPTLLARADEVIE